LRVGVAAVKGCEGERPVSPGMVADFNGDRRAPKAIPVSANAYERERIVAANLASK